MGYFDGLADTAFKRSNTGQTLFYPWGIFGSGFVLKTEEQHAKIRKLIKKTYIVLLIAIVIIQLTVGFWLNAVMLPIFGILYHIAVQKKTTNLSRTPEKLRFFESFRNSATSHTLATLIMLEAASIGFVAAGFWMLSKEGDEIVAMSSIGLFGLCGIAFGYMILVKIRQ